MVGMQGCQSMCHQAIRAAAAYVFEDRMLAATCLLNVISVGRVENLLRSAIN